MRLKLREVRQSKFVTQDELSALSGVTKAAISRIENGVRQPRISTVRRLAAALGVEPGELVERHAGQEGNPDPARE